MPGQQPVVSGQSVAFEKSYLIDSVPLSDLHYLGDHRVAGKVIYPAAGFCMAGIAVHQVLRVPANKHKPMVLENVKFRRPLSLTDHDTTVLQVSYKPDRSEFSVHSGPDDDLDAATPHAAGVLAGSKPELPVCDFDFDPLFASCSETIDVGKFYQHLSQAGLDYGPCFKRIVHARVSNPTGEAVTRISSHHGLTTSGDLRARQITLLDCAFQSLAATLNTDHFNLYVPSRIRALRVYSDFESDLRCYARLTSSTNRAVVGDITVFNADNRPLMDIHGLRCLKIPHSRITRCNADNYYRKNSGANNVEY